MADYQNETDTHLQLASETHKNVLTKW